MGERDDLLLVKRMIDEALPKFDWGGSALDADAIDLLNRAPAALARAILSVSAPIDMVMFCPACGIQHIDAPDHRSEIRGGELCVDAAWDNPPHRSHLCGSCGHTWRPADVPTNGVQGVSTKGENDSPITQPKSEYIRLG